MALLNDLWQMDEILPTWLHNIYIYAICVHIASIIRHHHVNIMYMYL